MDTPTSTAELDTATLLADLSAAVVAGHIDEARAIAARLVEHQADEFLDDLTRAELARLFEILGDESLGDLISQLHDTVAAGILERMPAADAADILEEIDPDDATDIFSEVDPVHGSEILVQMEPDEAEELRELLAYPPETAGGIMTPAFVSIAPSLRADQAIAALRKVAEDAETIYYVYVTDRDDHLLGVLSLHRLVLTRPETPVSELMIADPVRVLADTDQEEAARILVANDLLALPVVDEDDRILGIITADDIAEVIEEETTEDIERLGGSQPLEEPYLRASPVLLFRKRIPWLLVLFMAQFLTVSIIGHYESAIAQATVLSLFIPVLIGTGGNIGSQTVSTLIRAMAMGDVRPKHLFRVVPKEALTGAALGLSMAALMFVRALLTHDGTTEVALTVAVTVFVIAVWAATVGAVLPIVLSRLHVDPAVVSAPFISSLVDSTGLIIYFTLATLIMGLS